MLALGIFATFRFGSTMYKNNSGLITKTKVSKYNKGLCLTERLVYQNPLLFLY